MQCPLCTIELNMTTCQGIEIDLCPKCRGIWLDQGELEELIERPVPKNAARSDRSGGLPEKQGSRFAYHGFSHGERNYKHKKKSTGFLCMRYLTYRATVCNGNFFS